MVKSVLQFQIYNLTVLLKFCFTIFLLQLDCELDIPFFKYIELGKKSLSPI